MKVKIPDTILNSISPGKLMLNEPMSAHTSICTGGKAAVLIVPDTLAELCFVLGELRNQRNYAVIGNGHNTLVSDSGYSGIIVKTSNIKGLERYGKYITAYAGETMSTISDAAYKEELTGFEWACVDGGTLGAAIYGNISHFGSEIRDSIEITEVITKSGEVLVLKGDVFLAQHYKNEISRNGHTVLRAILRLNRGDTPLMQRLMARYRKNASSILGKIATGEAFAAVKAGTDAKKVIADCGLAGKTVGGACICAENPIYIINDGTATSADVCNLANDVIFTVLQKKGVQLKHNFKLIGKF